MWLKSARIPIIDTETLRHLSPFILLTFILFPMRIYAYTLTIIFIWQSDGTTRTLVIVTHCHLHPSTSVTLNWKLSESFYALHAWYYLPTGPDLVLCSSRRSLHQMIVKTNYICLMELVYKWGHIYSKFVFSYLSNFIILLCCRILNYYCSFNFNPPKLITSKISHCINREIIFFVSRYIHNAEIVSNWVTYLNEICILCAPTICAKGRLSVN